jgi:hypothetical protein
MLKPALFLEIEMQFLPQLGENIAAFVRTKQSTLLLRHGVLGLNVIVFEQLALFLNSKLLWTMCKKRKVIYVRMSVNLFVHPHGTVRYPLDELQ